MTVPNIVVLLVSLPHLGIESGQVFRADTRGNSADIKLGKGQRTTLKQGEWRLATPEEITEFEEREANPGGERVEAKAASEINNGSKAVEPIENQPNIDTEKAIPATGVGAPPIQPNQPALVEVAQNDAAAAGQTPVEDTETEDEEPTGPTWDDEEQVFVNTDGTIQQPESDNRRAELGLSSVQEEFNKQSEQGQQDNTLTGNETDEELRAKGYIFTAEGWVKHPVEEQDEDL